MLWVRAENARLKSQSPNIVGSISGHKEGCKAFASYQNIDEDIKNELVNLLDQFPGCMS